MTHSIVNYPSDGDPQVRVVTPTGDVNAGVAALTTSIKNLADNKVNTSGLRADLSAASHKITNLTDPSSAQDASTKAYADLKMSKANNLSDVASVSSAKTNLGLATVASSGVYADLLSKPSLFSGVYADLTSKPTLFSGVYADLTSKPSLFSGVYTDLTSKPTLGTVAALNTGYVVGGVPVYVDAAGNPGFATLNVSDGDQYTVNLIATGAWAMFVSGTGGTLTLGTVANAIEAIGRVTVDNNDGAGSTNSVTLCHSVVSSEHDCVSAEYYDTISHYKAKIGTDSDFIINSKAAGSFTDGTQKVNLCDGANCLSTIGPTSFDNGNITTDGNGLLTIIGSGGLSFNVVNGLTSLDTGAINTNGLGELTAPKLITTSLNLAGLRTSPGSTGDIWNDSGTLKVSP